MVEIIPKPEEEVSLGERFFFYISIILLVSAVVSYFVLVHLQKKAEDGLTEVEQKISQELTPEKRGLEKRIFSYQVKIQNFSKLLGQHRLSTKVFEKLEDLVHQKVWFTSLNLDSKESLVKISGKAESFQALSQQLLIFRAENLIKKANLTNISLGEEGEIEFSFLLSLDPEIFKYK
jgi:Tfp pilus assembly protein PilN